MRFTILSAASLLLVGSASLAEGHAERGHHRVVRSPNNAGSHPMHNTLAARSVDVSVHKNDPRTLCLLNGILGGKFDKYCSTKKPSCSWTCSGSGLDGWDYDCDGNKCPGHLPAGWKWFGKDKGWGPPKNYWCDDNQDLPWDFLNKCSLFTWWSVPHTWTKCPINFYPPHWWPVKPPVKTTTTAPPPPPTTTTTTTTAPATTTTAPACHAPPKDWQSCGNGLDGFDFDYDCKPCPYTADKLFDSNGKWKFFGSKYGWQPSEPWNIPYPTWSPPQGWTESECAKATWWSPGSEWQYPSSWTSVTALWKKLNPNWCSYLDKDCGKDDGDDNGSGDGPARPPQGWQCDGSGNDGWDVDYDGKGCPFVGDKLFDSNGKWKFFGSNKGWQPSEPWNIPYPTWSPPQGWTESECAKATWWSPGSEWQYPSSWTSVTSLWKKLNPSWCSYLDKNCGNDHDDHPDEDWECDESGDDGKDHDDQGRPCPWGNGWLWFGKKHGWLPPKGWTCAKDWQPPSDCDLGKATWWFPSNNWICPDWFKYKIPSFWKIKFNFHPANWCPTTFVCNKSGQDGWDYDHDGNGKPDWCPQGFKWFGVAAGWQPHSGWTLPYKSWTPPRQWEPKQCPWWKPTIQWQLPQGYFCPIWWPKSLLLGNLLNFF